MSSPERIAGRVVPAIEHALDAGQLQDARRARRSFMGKALAMGAGAAAISARAAQAIGDGDPAILDLPEHSKGLGQGVATHGYGMPSQHERNLQRRDSGAGRIRRIHR